MKCSRTPRPCAHWSITQPRNSARLAQPLQYSDHPLAGQRYVHLDGQAFPGPLIDHRECAKASSVEQTVVYEIGRPRGVGRLRQLPHYSPIAQPLASPPPAQGQSFFPVQPLDALVIDCEAFATEDP